MATNSASRPDTDANVAEASRSDETILLHQFDLEETHSDHPRFGFFSYRRPEMNGA